MSAGDTQHSANITDHPFSPKVGEEWGLCKFAMPGGKTCNMSGATHSEGPYYVPTAERPTEKHL